MKHPISTLGGFIAGLLVMYYLDAVSGGRRRALARDRLIAAGHDAADLAEMKGKRMADRLKGVAATGRADRISHSAPASDAQLHDRIRSRLGRLVSHPKAIDVDVEDGCVCLRGNILRKEVEPLLAEVGGMAGVREVRDELRAHDSAEGIPELQGSGQTGGRERQPAGQM